jgi:hypothetical protein
MTTPHPLTLDDITPLTSFVRELKVRGIATPYQVRWWVRSREKNGLTAALSERHGRIFVIRPRFLEWLAGNHEIRQPRTATVGGGNDGQR